MRLYEGSISEFYSDVIQNRIADKISNKYESFNTRSLMNLKAQALYFGPPRNFNDPYDCAITAIAKEPSSAELDKIRNHYLNDPENLEDRQYPLLKVLPPITCGGQSNILLKQGDKKPCTNWPLELTGSTACRFVCVIR